MKLPEKISILFPHPCCFPVYVRNGRSAGPAGGSVVIYLTCVLPREKGGWADERAR